MFIVYDSEGRIVRTMICPYDALELNVREGEQWMLGNADAALNTVVVDAVGIPAIVPRPTMDPVWSNLPLQANGQNVTLLLDLPDPCRVVYAGPGFAHVGEVVGGVAEFTTDVVGTHKITVQAWPYLDWSEEIDAI